MGQIKEKVKDLVEVKRHIGLESFWADPIATLESYHFTDGTAELMAKWLGCVLTAEKAGISRAVAGFRGVGKSHFLSIFAGIVAHPELRAKIGENHVRVAAQELPRRHFPVVNIRRGSGTTLRAELAEAVAQQFELDLSTLETSPIELLRHARARTGDLPLVVIVDTAADREAAIDRNDGAELSEIAQFCLSNGIFIAVALDDDIAGADGDNVSIAQHFSIDYIDQEHLYRAVSARIFVKEPRKQESIRSIYESIRSSTKGFRWSEERFIALYPLHPGSIEVTPFIRRFVPDFSILNFASAAGERILSRPADSLIGLEELFEAAEPDLRRNEELKTAFESFDSLQTSVVEKVPVKDRHRIKLFLKALLILSLDGTGKSAQEVVAGLMLSDAGDDPVAETSRILDSFAAASPDGILVDDLDGSTRTYCFRTGLDEHSAELLRWIAVQPAEAIDDAFLAAIARRFVEFGMHDLRAYGRNAVKMSLEWRGSMRRGLLIFGEAADGQPELETDPNIEWELYFNIDMGGLAFEPNTYPARISWRPDTLLPEERRVLLALMGLSNDQTLRHSFGENLSTSEHAHTVAAAKVIDRVLFESGRLEIEGFDYNFTEQARNADGLANAMSTMFEPLFETRYPEHPSFPEVLRESEMESATRSFYSASEVLTDELAKAARCFGVPLGIVRDDNGSLQRASKDELAVNPFCQLVLDLVNDPQDPIVELTKVDEILRQPPLGLCLEGRRLILASLTANGFIDLVTKDGNRINGRSLDLKLAWDSLRSIALPRAGNVSDETILKWANAISGSEEIDSLRVPDHRSGVLASLVDISNGYSISRNPREMGTWLEFGMNASTWRDMVAVSENFERVIDSVEETLVGGIELESCIAHISNSFGDRTTVFQAAQQSAARIETFFRHSSDVELVHEYVSRAEHTSSETIEEIRASILAMIDEFRGAGNEELGREIKYLFDKFVKQYSESYSSIHSRVFEADGIQFQISTLLNSDDSKRIRSAFVIGDFALEFRPHFRNVNRRVEDLSCKLDPSDLLKTQPHCRCSLRFSDIGNLTDEVDDFRGMIEKAFDRLAEMAGMRSAEVSDELLTLSGPAAAGLRDIILKGEPFSTKDLDQDQFDLLVESLEKAAIS